MTTDFKASQVQTNRVVVTGSFAGGGANQLLIYSIDADDALTPNQGQIDPSVFDTSAGIGTDVFAFVSGSISQKDVGGTYGVTVFGGDIHISGNLTIDGTGGGGGGGGGDSYWSSTTTSSIFTTGSVLIRSDDGSGTDAASDYGTDNFLFVSGTIGGKGESSAGVAVFGGDTIVSGALHALTMGVIGDFDPFPMVNGFLHVVGGTDASEGTFIDTDFYPRLRLIGGAGSFVSTTLTNAGVSLNNTGQQASFYVGTDFGLLEADYTLVLRSVDVFGDGIRAECSSFLIRSDDGSDTIHATDYGTDNFLFVSGAIGGKGGSSPGVATMGGDLVVSGALHGAPDFLRVGTDTQVTGTLFVSGNFRLGEVPIVPADVGFFVSGAAGGQSTILESTALFAGDLVTSGNFHQLAGLRLSVTSVTTTTPAYTASILDYIIAVSASSGDGIALPSGAQQGKSYIIKDVSGSAAASNIIVSGTGGELIDGQLGETIAIDYGSIQVVYFGPGIGWGVI